MAIFSKIAGWLIGGGIGAIGKQINEAYANKLKARTSEQALAADLMIAQLQAQQAILLAEQGSWMTRPIRPLFALPFIIYNFKIIVWDKVLALGTTDPLPVEMIELEMIMIGAYFVGRPIEKYLKGRASR